MKKTLITITLNDDDLDKILPEGTPKAGVRRAKVAATVCTNIVQTVIGGVKRREKAQEKPVAKESKKPDVEKIENVKNACREPLARFHSEIATNGSGEAGNGQNTKPKEEPKKTTAKKTPTKKATKK